MDPTRQLDHHSAQPPLGTVDAVRRLLGLTLMIWVALITSACSDVAPWSSSLRVLQVEAAADDTTLLVTYECTRDPASDTATVHEFTDHVEIEVRGKKARGDCARQVALELGAPLGDREVLERGSGDLVPIHMGGAVDAGTMPGGQSTWESAGCISAPEGFQDRFGTAVTALPAPLMAGEPVELWMRRINPEFDTEVVVSTGPWATWECWDGETFIPTHHLYLGSEQSPGDAVFLVDDGSTTTVPAVALSVPGIYVSTTPDVDPGWYRIRVDYLEDGDIGSANLLMVEVVASDSQSTTTAAVSALVSLDVVYVPAQTVAVQAVTLHNRGTESIDLSRWTIATPGYESRAFEIPGGTWLTADAVLTVYQWERAPEDCPPSIEFEAGRPGAGNWSFTLCYDSTSAASVDRFPGGMVEVRDRTGEMVARFDP